MNEHKSLDDLITTLKSEAIEAAQTEAAQLIETAKAQARQIMEEVQAQRSQLLSEAEAKANIIVETGESALRQAARDLNLAVQNDLIRALKSVLEAEVRAVFTPNLVKTALVKVLANIGGTQEVRLPEAFAEELAEYIQQQLQESNTSVSIIQESERLQKLTITKTQEGWSYHISPETIAELLHPYLINKWVRILEKGQTV